MNTQYFTLVLVAAILLLGSFKFKVDSKFSKKEMEAINQEIDDRVQAFILRQQKECEASLMKKVEIQVDSMIMLNFKELVQDEDDIPPAAPPKPTAPEKPTALEPQDSTPLRPLLDQRDFED